MFPFYLWSESFRVNKVTVTQVEQTLGYETSVENINICSNYNKYTIVPTIINHDYYYSTYQELKNGKIFLYNILNDNNIKELNVLIKGLSNLGYKIVSLDELIKE